MKAVVTLPLVVMIMMMKVALVVMEAQANLQTLKFMCRFFLFNK
jgi:hypothetical protein